MSTRIFVIDLDESGNLVNILNYEQLGKLLFAIYCTEREKDVFTEHPELSDPAVMVAYDMLLKQDIDCKEAIWVG